MTLINNRDMHGVDILVKAYIIERNLVVGVLSSINLSYIAVKIWSMIVIEITLNKRPTDIEINNYRSHFKHCVVHKNYVSFGNNVINEL